MLSLEGQQLGNYDIIRRIRMGGMGAVYEGRQRTAFGRRVAIKVILGDYAADRDMRRRFAREARTVAKLHHPHILQLIEFGDEQGILYLVMPFIEGGTLTSYLRRGLPGVDEVSAIYQQLLDAVEYAHDAGLVHRDIKSSNVLLEERRSGAPYVYLADFGLVRSAHQSDTAKTGKSIPLDQVPGTPHYMAPEQTRGIVTPQTDIYALGVLLYQMLTGELPYNDSDDVRVIEMHLYDPIPSPCDFDISIPRKLNNVVRMAMAKQPEERFHSVGELRDAFLNALQGSAPDAIEQPDDLLIEDVDEDDFSPPLRRLPTPLPLQDMSAHFEPADKREEMKPLRFERTETVPVAVREERKPQRVSSTVKLRPRITEEPGQDQPKVRQREVPLYKRNSNIWVLATMIVSLVLIALLLMPRVLGFSFFPPGFPLLGSASVATIYLTPQSKAVSDKYVLIASPKVKQADPVKHTIPSRVIQTSASASDNVSTTGTRTVGGVPARGTILVMNAANTSVAVMSGNVLTTGANVRFAIEQSVNVPAHQNGQDGTATVSVVAVQPGTGGNIPAHALDGPCCNNALLVKNTSPFSGGVDAQIVHTVLQSDIDGARDALVTKLQGQVHKQLQQQLTKNEAMVNQATYAVNVSSDNPVGTQADQINVKVNIVAKVTVYNLVQARDMAMQLLRTQAVQTLDHNYQPQNDVSVAGTPTAQSGNDGSAFVSVSVHGIWAYVFSQQQVDRWRQSIKGATSAAALAYLNAQAGIASVQLSLPFGSDHLPTSIDEIKVVKVNQ